MPLLTVIAPGTRVRVIGMSLPGAEVEKVRIKAGVNPIVYDVAWIDNGMKHSARFNALAVESIEEQVEPVKTGSLRELGSLFARQAGQAEQQGKS